MGSTAEPNELDSSGNVSDYKTLGVFYLVRTETEVCHSEHQFIVKAMIMDMSKLATGLCTSSNSLLLSTCTRLSR